MNVKRLVTAAAAALALSVQAQAATVYNFWFDNDPSQGDVNGTVFGKIYGLGDNGFFNASDVVVYHNPGVAGLPSTPFSIKSYASSLGLFISKDFFFVHNSQIQYGVYQIYGGYFDLNVYCCGVNYNSLVSPDARHRVQNLDGIGPAPALRFAAAPEPTAWALMLGGFGLAGAAPRRRRRAVTA